MRRPLQACLPAAIAAGVIAMAGNAGAASLPSRARLVHGGGGWPETALGNGRFNHNSFIINSPSISHDIQHIRNINVGGNTLTPAAICKHAVHRCKIIQRAVVDRW